ncbi:MAG: PP2C family protein-serine/threonine phosphatase [Planctomycetota bacterium]
MVESAPPATLTADAAFHVALHRARTQGDLERLFVDGLTRLLPGRGAAICLACDDAAVLEVRGVSGPELTAQAAPLRVGRRVAREDRGAARGTPIVSGDHALGELWVEAGTHDEELGAARDALAHFGTALVNLTLQQEVRAATDDYCGTVQALEEGILLFQEPDEDAMVARILALVGGMVHAQAGALYVFDEVGSAAAPLQLRQGYGIPDALLAELKGADGAPWPDVFAGQQAQVLERDGRGRIAMLDPACALPMLERVAVVPLRYHGVQAGLCVLFNPGVDVEQGVYGRLETFGQLAAALLHRLSLERIKERSVSIERELQLAETIQQRLVPSDPPPSDAFDFAWCSQAAARIGGDYVDFLTSAQGDIQAVVADVSGHGINSALLMTSFRANFRGSAFLRDVHEQAASLNDAVAHEVGPTGMFLTAALVRLDPRTRLMELCSAGHNPVMVYRAAEGAVELLGSHGTPMGFLAGVSYERDERQLQPGDVVLLYTDGITEAAAPSGEMFGEDRLQAVLRRHARDGAQAALDAALDALASFTGRRRQEDDVSLLVIRVR